MHEKVRRVRGFESTVAVGTGGVMRMKPRVHGAVAGVASLLALHDQEYGEDEPGPGEEYWLRRFADAQVLAFYRYTVYDGWNHIAANSYAECAGTDCAVSHCAGVHERRWTEIVRSDLVVASSW